MLSSTLPTKPVLPRISSLRPRKISDGDSTGAAGAAPVETSSIGPAFYPARAGISRPARLLGAGVGAGADVRKRRAGAFAAGLVASDARAVASGVAADAGDAEAGDAVGVPRAGGGERAQVAAPGRLAIAAGAVGVGRAAREADRGRRIAQVGRADDG